MKRESRPLFTYETIYRQQTTLKPCTSIWQWLLLAWMWLKGEEPKRGVRRGKPKPVWVKLNPESALEMALRFGYNRVRLFNDQWVMAV